MTRPVLEVPQWHQILSTVLGPGLRWTGWGLVIGLGLSLSLNTWNGRRGPVSAFPNSTTMSFTTAVKR